jgi:acyl-coenzyme A synthetase/AMP-(fatty) acid ligase
VTSVPPSVARVLDRALEQRPDAEGGLWELGVRPGDRVAATLPNDLDVVVAFHAVMRLGAIWVGIPDALAVPEKDRLLQHCRPRAYLCESVAAEGLGAAGHYAPLCTSTHTPRPGPRTPAAMDLPRTAHGVERRPEHSCGICCTAVISTVPIWPA